MDILIVFLVGTAVIMGVLAFCLAILKQDAQDEGCNMPEDTVTAIPLSHMSIVFKKEDTILYLNGVKLEPLDHGTLSFWFEDRGLSNDWAKLQSEKALERMKNMRDSFPIQDAPSRRGGRPKGSKNKK